MPTYRFEKNGEEQDVFCKMAELNELTERMKADGWKRVITAPAIVGMTGSVLSKTDDGWKDVLKKIKKGSGRKNTINV